VEPLLLPPKAAFAAIGVGTTKGYELINAGKLEAVKIGRATRIKVSSLKSLVDTLDRGES